MTTAIENTEYTQAQIAHRRACAYLKGLLCGYADKQGHKYETTHPRTPDFDAGFKQAQGRLWDVHATSAHIIHNQLRYRPLHVAEDHRAHGWKYIVARWVTEHLGDDLAAELEVLNG